MYKPRMIRQKIQFSELVVRLDNSLSKISPKLNSFAEKVTEAYQQPWLPAFQVIGMSIGTDSTNSAVKPSSFMLERKIGAPFNENRFYTKASLHTDKHMELLTEFESLLG